MGLAIGLLCRFHDLGSSSNRHAHLVLFDSVTFLQGPDKFLDIILGKDSAHAEVPSDLIDYL